MEWGQNWKKLTDRELEDVEFRLEAVRVATLHGVVCAAAQLNRRNPDRQVDVATVRRWVRDYERSVALDLAILAAADEPMN